MFSPPTTRPELVGTFGMVSSTHWLASATAMSILEAGGNAFDAATGAGFVLQVVEPHLNGPGGECPIIGRPAGGDVFVVSGQGPAPAGATIDAFSDRGYDFVPGTGLLAACVPGAFGAWMSLLRDFGTRRPEEVLGPAIGYARKGYPLLPRIVLALAEMAEIFDTTWPGSAEVYARAARSGGPLLANEALATTFERLLRSCSAGSREQRIQAALDYFYRGPIAAVIASFCETGAPDADGRHERAFLDGDDLASWSAAVEEPISFDYRGHLVHKAGPWTQGPVLLQQLALLEDADPARMSVEEFAHVVVEGAKLAFADREAHYGDPSFVEVPLSELLARSYASERRRLIGPEASYELRPGLGASLDGLPAAAAVGGPGVGEPTLPGDTCHVAVADRAGNIVAATPSGGWLQSSPVIPELGFPLSTRAQMFWLVPGHPNAPEPRKRPRTTLSPSLAQGPDGGVLAFGTPGGDQQDQWSLLFFSRVVDLGLGLQQAIEAPMFHTTHFPSSFYPRTAEPGAIVVEESLGRDVIAGLRARGHGVVESPAWSLGRLCAVGHDPATGVLRAAADPRAESGYAAGR